MFATVLYWIICAVLILWGAWSAIWSLIYLADGQGTNGWFYAILNLIVLILAGLVFWIYSNPDWQWFWFASKQTNISLYGILLICYIVMIIFQFVTGFPKKQKANA